MTLEERVLAELLAIRKTRHGLTLTTMARCRVTASLLGGGDPGLAFNRIRTQLLDRDFDLAIGAAVASLGLSSDADTHLGRLTEFGMEHGYDQRQARRYSDRGIREIAALVAMRWSDAGTPSLDLTILEPGDDRLEIHLTTTHIGAVSMHKPVVRLRLDEHDQELSPSYAVREADHSVYLHTIDPFVIHLTTAAASLTTVWNGELWPKFLVTLQGPRTRNVAVETLGAKLMVRW